MNPSEFVAYQLSLQDQIRAAFLTMACLPDTDRQVLRSCERGSWPSFRADREDWWVTYGKEQVRMPRVHPSPDEIDSMNEVIGWISWLAAQHEDEAKTVTLCFGLNKKSSYAARRLHIHRTTVIRLRKAGLQRIAHHLLTIHKKVA